MVVVSERYPEPSLEQSAFGLTSLSRDELADFPQGTLDDLLRSAVPGFSLFRRTSSEVANPTTQGPTLRNIGPNGAGRTLVVLDGVPQNDPFGGWVYWSRLPPALLGSVDVVRGGGAGLFGNNALGGTLHLTRRQPRTLSLDLTAGDHETFGGTLLTSLPAGAWQVSLAMHGQTTGGYPIIRQDQRGPIDIDADSSSYLFEGSVSRVLESGAEMWARASWFEEERGNGTPYTGNRTEALDLSLGLRGPEGDVRWETVFFYQDRTFASTFSSVNEDRTAETPALDQHEVPAHSFGWSFTTTFAGGLLVPGAEREGSRLITGVDARWIEGETRERFRFVDGAFLNHRVAGGEHLLLGMFAEQTWRLSPDLLLVLGGRADYWRLSSGRRVERTLATGAALLDDDFPDRDGAVANGRLGLAYELSEAVQVKSSAYTGFRVPTLNELYRPFRVRNDVTGANDALEPERLVGVEAGVTWKHEDKLTLGATVYWNRLHDAVANVTLLQGPGTAPDGTFIPAGGVFRQRRNVDSVTTTGVELDARWTPEPWLGFEAGYLYSQTEVHAASRELNGRELAQAPAHVLTGGITLQPDKRWRFALLARYGGEQFEDDLNTLVLGSYVVWDASLSCRVREDLTVSLVIQNLFDREVETGRSADGIVSVGAPRWFGVKVQWEF